MTSTNFLIQLGRRLRERIEPEDAAAYDAYRTEFAPALAEVVLRCRALDPRAEESARLKTLESVRAKLQRQAIRLPRIQDIAGVRFVVESLEQQERLLAQLLIEFPAAHIDDYRWAPQNGYRAVHGIVRSTSGHMVEVQLRTALQNAWANTCEVLAVEVDAALKYGGGPEIERKALRALSVSTLALESARRDRRDTDVIEDEVLAALADLARGKVH